MSSHSSGQKLTILRLRCSSRDKSAICGRSLGLRACPVGPGMVAPRSVSGNFSGLNPAVGNRRYSVRRLFHPVAIEVETWQSKTYAKYGPTRHRTLPRGLRTTWTAFRTRLAFRSRLEDTEARLGRFSADILAPGLTRRQPRADRKPVGKVRPHAPGSDSDLSRGTRGQNSGMDCARLQKQHRSAIRWFKREYPGSCQILRRQAQRLRGRRPAFPGA